MIPHQRWTQTALTDLRQRVKDGATCAEIATAMGRPPETVQSMMRRFQLREIEPAVIRDRP